MTQDQSPTDSPFRIPLADLDKHLRAARVWLADARYAPRGGRECEARFAGLDLLLEGAQAALTKAMAEKLHHQHVGMRVDISRDLGGQS